MSLLLPEPEGFERQADVFEVLYQKMRAGAVVRGLVQSVDFPDSIPTWLITFPDIDINGEVIGLVPESETGLDRALMTRFIQQPVNVQIMGVDRDNGLVACSRLAAVNQLSDRIEFKEGQLVTCSVRAIKPNPEGKRPLLTLDVGGGILVDIPYADARISFTKPLREQYKIGQLVTAKVTKINYGNQVSLSLKDARPSPWDNAKFRRGQIIAGTIARINNNNLVFIEPDLYPGILGIAPYPIRGSLRNRQKVKCNVAAFSAEDKKLRLRIRPQGL